MGILDTEIKNVKNVVRYTIGAESIYSLEETLNSVRHAERPVVFYIDEFFADRPKIVEKLPIEKNDEIVFVTTDSEPTTEYIDECVRNLHSMNIFSPSAVVGMGGGITLDTGKAISNLLTNGGKAEDYQGWDLLKNPGIFKIAIPTLSGTGAEATRTCVMTNKKTGLKLGMNSDYTVYDRVIMDPDLTSTVPRDQYFYTGMDAYIHCIESLEGSYRNAIGDAYSHQTLSLCRQVFKSDNMMSESNREKLMVASYLGGCAIATSYVGLIHPLSAGLSVVLGIHHCLANCMVMRAMKDFYPLAFKEFWQMVELQGVKIESGICGDLSQSQYDRLYEASIMHEKPLTNALGVDFKKILTKEKVIELYKGM